MALIGGTGVGSILAQNSGRCHSVPTPFGAVDIVHFEHEGVRVAALQRHSAGHRVPPHLVNYRAIALAVCALGVKACFSTAAIGSLRTEWTPGTFASVTDFIDLSGRNITLFDQSVQHTDVSDAFPVSRLLRLAGERLGIAVHPSAIYVNTNGPRYETPAEIAAFQKLGGDVIGMTVGTEAVVMREAGVDYGCLAIVTNLAAGLSPGPLSHGEVSDVMTECGPAAVRILLEAGSLAMAGA